MQNEKKPDPIARHFRQIVMWPFQLMPRKPGDPMRHHWRAFEKPGAAQGWHEVEDEFTSDSSSFQERHYREFVTFLPHVQRFLYGQGRSRASTHGYGESPMHVFRHRDVARARLTFPDGFVLTLHVQHVDLYFYYDVDVCLLVLECYADDVPLQRVLDIGYRFARSYPAQWDERGVADQCMRNVEWLDREGRVLMESDFDRRRAFLNHACEHREARIAKHWDYLLRPLVQHETDQAGDIRFRHLDYHHLPHMTYLSFDDPFELTSEHFFRLGMAIEPEDGSSDPLPRKVLSRFERQQCYDFFWAPECRDPRSSTRIVCTPRATVMVGCARRKTYTDPEAGMLSQFRHQYFLLGMIVHFHHAALLMLSDRMVLAVSRLAVDNPESLERFRSHMRETTEIFLRFNHRYWFHDVSKHFVAREVFRLWSRQLDNDALFQEVREELLDMGHYLDSDAARRQSDVVLRLTVVAIFGLIGTIATGFLGMNLIDETDQPLGVKIAYFAAVLIPSVVLTFLTVLNSGKLARFVDALATERANSRDP